MLNADAIVGQTGNLLSYNMFTYCLNNPVNMADHNGYFPLPLNIILNYLHYNRNIFNTDIPTSIISAEKQLWIKLEDYESYFHQLGDGNLNNVKYVSPNQNREVVFDSVGNIVTDPLNKGTYNVFGPDNTFGHLIADVVPYIIWGNSPNDPSNILDRMMWSIDALDTSQPKEKSLRGSTFEEFCWKNLVSVM